MQSATDSSERSGLSPALIDTGRPGALRSERPASEPGIKLALHKTLPCDSLPLGDILFRRLGSPGFLANNVCVSLEHGKKSWRFRLVAAGAGLLSGVLLLEAAFRCVSPPDPPIPTDSRENSALVNNTRNRLNLRESWDSPPGDEYTIRILFLGDSFTYGASVEPDECFVHLVEQRLNKDQEDRCVTINAGAPGTATEAQAQIYHRLREEIRPDIVVHVLYCNDWGHDLYDDLKIIHRLQNRRTMAADYSHAWRFVESRIRYLLVKQRTIDYFQGGNSPFKRLQAWQSVLGHLERLKADVEGDGAVYAVVMFPWLWGLDAYPLKAMHDKMARHAAAMNVPFLDLLDAFRDRDATALRISATDEHPNPAGHRIAADAIARFVEREVLPHVQKTREPSDD